ncbi:SusC/RagA family TonB-linked outer membrane protein [Parapedobacter tibetensis]|uniref:SusC/RagA family TonB-linked outer membrane protein n=1 Tax=Parapedobacter tibetensis TaxID=2972951 RepID=UPI00214D798A|nr:SusC/RagA family TonB-linked outer membrane protein [Parapedobacter tibetensis]
MMDYLSIGQYRHGAGRYSSKKTRLIINLVCTFFVLVCIRGYASTAGKPMDSAFENATKSGFLMSNWQEEVVVGKVYNVERSPMQGVSVNVSGKSIETVTDEQGGFRLVATMGDSLVFSYLGYQSTTVVVDGKPITVTMISADATDLEEVVIVGYGTQKKSNLTGAVSAVDAKELTNIAPSNLSNTLAGRAPGVNVTNTSGLAGATSQIRIRGSFGEPLYVIDGMVRDKAAFDALEAFEVDQMSFLKDAATASIYGSRAGNGVVLVTTRKGVEQKPTFNFQSNYTTGRPTQTLLSDLTTATDELIYQNRVAEFNGTPIPNGDEEFDYFSNRSYNVHDFIWRNSNSHRQSISVTGGSDKITYYSLLSYRGEQGSYKSLDHGKVNLRSNVSAKINESISIDLNLSAYQQNGDRFYWPFTDDDDYDVSDLYRVTFNWPKTYPFYTEADGTPANYVTDYPVQTPMGSWLAWSVIDQVIGDRYIKTRERQFNPILSLNVGLDKFIPGLSTKVVGSYLGEDYMRKKYLTFQTNYVFNQADPDGNRFIPAPPDPNRTNTFNFSQDLPFVDYEITTNWAYQFNWFVNYNRTFNKHSVDALFVYEQAEDGLYTAYAKRESPLTPSDQMFAYPYGRAFEEADGLEEIGARQSFIGRANYNFDNRYIAEFSFRYDGNTLFPEHKRWGFFPSMSAAWRISEEAFFQNASTAVNELKLRASYGTTGNDLMINTDDRIEPFSYVNRYLNSGGYMFGDRYYGSIAVPVTPNPNLTWATSTSYNAGVDIAVFNNKLTGALDVFLREEKDILGTRLVTLPDNYGQALAPENYAARSWRGGELSAQWNDQLSANNEINYSVMANIGYSKDRWDIYDESAAFGPGGNRHFESRIGLPHERIIGLKALGIVRTQEQLDELLAQGFKQYGRDPYLGGLYFEDVRGDGYAPGADGKIDGNDIQLLSTKADPRINYGFGFNISYKNFALQTHFQGVMNYDRIISNQEGAGMRQHGGAVRPYYPIWASDDVWTPDNIDGKYPRPIGQNWYESGTGASSFWITNGAYLRLRTLNFAYSLPETWVSALQLEHVQLFFNGTNLFVLSAMTEFHDPEQKNYDSYPVMKTFTFGLDVRF